MKKLLIILYFFFSNKVYSQGIDNTWLMGYLCCTTYFHPMNLEFSSGSLVIDTVTRNMNFCETNGEICDKSGNLLFYSNGVYIANANNDTMLNGSGLNPADFTTDHKDYGLTIPQANLIIPFPDDSMKYYLFHETADDYPGATYSSFFLYYSIIDMNLDNGLGAVIQKNSILLNDTLVEGRLTACKHANGRDWWLISHEFRKNNIYTFLITPGGIQGPFLNYSQTQRDNYFGQSVFSPQGDKYVYYEPYDDLDIFDFDRCTGALYNQLHIAINDSAGAGGVAFSPSGRYLYVSSTYYVYQFDMYASNIAASQTRVAVWDTFYAPFPPAATIFYLAALAPDGKIYINSSNSTMVLHVINYPDSSGISCDVCQNCILLPAINAFTIPNHPNYFLGPEVGSVCDSLNIGINDVPNAKNTFNLFPNPTNRLVYITQKANEAIRAVEVFNTLGQKMDVKYSSIKNNEYMEINVQHLTPGVYFLEMITDREKVVKRFVRE
jgi:WD40 repeat protein